MLPTPKPGMSQKIASRLGVEIRNVLNGLTFKKKFNVDNTVAIFGAPRSGTTWLTELINANFDYLTITRPMSFEWFPQLRSYSFRKESRLYYHPETENVELEKYLLDVFTGNVNALKGANLHYNLRVRECYGRLKAEKLLVKINSGVRLLPWIKKRFDLRKIFLVTRHPCATISSQIQAGGRVAYGSLSGYGVPSTDLILNEMSKMEFIEDSQITKIKKISLIEERLAAVWALDYLASFKYDQPFDVVCYEYLISYSNSEISRLFKTLGQEHYLKKALEIVRSPSMTTINGESKYLSNIELQLNKWQKRLTKNEISHISKVLGWFDMGFSDSEYNIIDSRFHF